MWVAKVRMSGEKGSIGRRAREFSISMSGFPVSFYETKKGIYVYIAGFLFGEEKNKEKFINDWRRDKKVLHFERKGDFLIAQIIEPLSLKPMYSHKLINLKPVFIDEQGFNHWEIGSWNKKDLIEFINLVEKKFDGELISMTQREISSFSILSMQPKLTYKQKKAIELALKHGYYRYPREIALEKLAKLMKISYSTYQAHLRKAEKKLLPFFFRRIK